MKKLIPLLLLTFIFMLPVKITNAGTIYAAPGSPFESQLKEKKELISERVKSNRKIQSEINNKAKRAADLYLIIFGSSAHPSEEDARKTERMEAQLGKLAESVIITEKLITKNIRLAAGSLQKGNYAQALSIYDNVIDLMDKQTDNLKKQNEYLQAYVDFLSSLKHK